MQFIVAVDKAYGIGKNNQLLTHLPGDLKYFQKLTMGKVLVMGRKTLESLPGGKPLKGRTTIVMSRNEAYEKEGVKIVHSISELLQEIKAYEEDDVFVAGGSAIYDKLIPLCTHGYVTKIDAAFEADTFIVNVDALPRWELVEKSEKQTHDGIDYYFTKYKNTSM